MYKQWLLFHYNSRIRWPTKFKIFIIWPFTKNLPIPDLEQTILAQLYSDQYWRYYTEECKKMMAQLWTIHKSFVKILATGIFSISHIWFWSNDFPCWNRNPESYKWWWPLHCSPNSFSFFYRTYGKIKLLCTLDVRGDHMTGFGQENLSRRNPYHLKPVHNLPCCFPNVSWDGPCSISLDFSLLNYRDQLSLTSLMHVAWVRN